MVKFVDISFNPYLISFIIISVAILTLELNVTLNKPIAFGDEAFHAYIAKYIGTVHTFPEDLPGFGGLYTYPPLLHIILSAIYSLPSVMWILAKMFVPIIAFLIGLSMFIFLSKIYNERLALMAAIITITLPIFITYSVLIYTDILMVLFFILSIMFTLIADKSSGKELSSKEIRTVGSYKYWILAVICASLSYLSKTTGAIVFLFIGGLLIYKFIRKELNLKQFFSISLISVIIILALCGWWWVRNYIDFKTIDCNYPLPFFKSECINISDQTTKENSDRFAGYISTAGSGAGVLNFGLTNFIQFMYGNSYNFGYMFLGIVHPSLLIVPLLASCGIVLILTRRNRNDIYLLILLFLSILPTLVITIQSATIRAEDIGRYLILTTVIISLIAATWLEIVFKVVEKRWKYFPLIIMFMLLIFCWFNFKPKLDVMYQIKAFSPMFFDACDWIKSNSEKDSSFMSLWAAPTVYNCERKAEWTSNDQADIVLSNNVTTALKALDNRKIDYIFIQKFSLSQTPYVASIPVSFAQFLENNPNTFKKVFENGMSFQDCMNQGGCDGNTIYKVIYQ